MTDSGESELSRRVRDNAFDLRAYLADRDVACPSCGYNIRSLTTDRCSECGAYLTVDAVSQRRPRPLPHHLKLAMTLLIVAEIGRVLWVAILHLNSIGIAMFWSLVVGLPTIFWYIQWTMTSAVVSKKHPWQLKALAVILWGMFFLDVCAMAACY